MKLFKNNIINWGNIFAGNRFLSYSSRWLPPLSSLTLSHGRT